MGSILLCLALLILMPHPMLSGSSPEIEQDTPHKISTEPRQEVSVTGLLSALSNRNILLTVPVFLVGIFRYAMLNILIQYASVRFGLRISTGATFYTETAIVNIFLFLFLVPRLTEYLRSRYHIPPQNIDLFLVRTSVILMCLGCLGIGFAQTAQVLPLGTPVLSFCFSRTISTPSLTISRCIRFCCWLWKQGLGTLTCLILDI